MRHGFDNWTTLTSIDPHTSVLYQRRPAGLVTAARDCVLLRTWRRDVDGSYIILLQDTEHAGAPTPRGGLFGGTVRAHVCRVVDCGTDGCTTLCATSVHGFC